MGACDSKRAQVKTRESQESPQKEEENRNSYHCMTGSKTFMKIQVKDPNVCNSADLTKAGNTSPLTPSRMNMTFLKAPNGRKSSHGRHRAHHH